MERSLLAMLCVAILLSACATTTTTQRSGNGRAVFMVADAAADMGSVTKMEVTIDRVEAHSATQGWVTVFNEAKTYDLMELRESG